MTLDQWLRALPVKMREEDKIKHMVWSFWMTVVALLLLPLGPALLLVFVLGLAKECWDAVYGSGFCYFDLLGNGIGSLAGWGTMAAAGWLVLQVA